jgi:hypothetical protein
MSLEMIKLVLIMRVNKIRLLAAYYLIPVDESCEISFISIDGDRHEIKISDRRRVSLVESLSFNRHKYYLRKWSRGKPVEFDPLTQAAQPKLSLVLVHSKSLGTVSRKGAKSGSLLSR